MSINKKLNKDYFKTKKEHKKEYGNISPKRGCLNTLAAFMIIFIPYFLLDKCKNPAKNSNPKTEIKTLVEDSNTIKKANTKTKEQNKSTTTLPLHGRLDEESLNKFYPKITDTISDKIIFGSEKLTLNLNRDIIVSLLHNTGTFDQMIVCTHNTQFNLIDHLYIGKSTMFESSSHTIEYEPLNNNTIQFIHTDWGYIDSDGEYEIGIIKSYKYNVVVDELGRITKEGLTDIKSKDK